MRVLIVAEFYPRRHDAVLGTWAHRQAVAARDAGADVSVLVMHRPIPSKNAIRDHDWRQIGSTIAHPLKRKLDGIDVRYIPFIAPSRSSSYGSWGAWAAPSLQLGLRYLTRAGSFNLIHAHYAAPVGDAVRRVANDTPFLISVHGGDVLSVPKHWRKGEQAVRAAFSATKLVLANSSAIAARSRTLGAVNTRVVHLGADVPTAVSDRHQDLVSLGHLIDRKRHRDLLDALYLLRKSHPKLRLTIIGDGPERSNLQRHTDELGLSERVFFCGQLDPTTAIRLAQQSKIMVLPSIDEAFGVAYVEAMAGGVPVIGCKDEPGPEEIASLGGGIRLVSPRKPQEIADAIVELIDDQVLWTAMSSAARANIVDNFTWLRCGEQTVKAYADVLSG